MKSINKKQEKEIERFYQRFLIKMARRRICRKIFFAAQKPANLVWPTLLIQKFGNSDSEAVP